jgi:hypothetical protein
MDTRRRGATRRLILWLAAAAALSGCVYPEPYPVTYDAYSGYNTAPTYYYYPYYYGYPAYVGPPLSFSFSYYSHHGGYGWGGHGWGGHGWGGHGWGGHGWGGHGWGGGHGGWHGRH